MIMKMIKDDEERKQKARRKTGFLEGNRFIYKENRIQPGSKRKQLGQCKVWLCQSSR